MRRIDKLASQAVATVATADRTTPARRGLSAGAEPHGQATTRPDVPPSHTVMWAWPEGMARPFVLRRDEHARE
jgi:hypothetical protein